MMKRIIYALLVFGFVSLVYGCMRSELYAHEPKGLDERIPVCLKTYPTDPALFNALVAPHVVKIIERHGIEEWKAILLTNELHRHLGMWSIIGAKMGIRARELLGAPFDQLNVISFCGYKPPFSCTNDGIQVSTGASLGRGTITNSHIGQPEAIFIYKTQRILLKVKPSVREKIGKEIKKLSEAYGFQSKQYFQALDRVSVKYWLEWNRAQIFEEVHY